MEKNKANIGILIGLSFSLAILYFIGSQLQWDLFFQEIKKLNYYYIPVISFLFVFSFVLRALRWRYLLPSHIEFSTLKLFSACILGMLATCILPLRAGEFVRPWVLSRSGKVSFSLSFSSVVTERVFDIFAMLTLCLFSLNNIANAPEWITLCLKALTALAFGILLLMILSYYKGNFVISFAQKILFLVFRSENNAIGKKIVEILQEFILGLKSISSFRELIIIIIYSNTLWFSFSLIYYLGLRSFGIEADFWVGNAVNVFVALAIAAPSAPGFIGTFQIGCIAALSKAYGYSNEFAVAYSIVMHSLQMILSLITGTIMLNYEGLSFKQLKEHNI
ncbi:MAG: flippase-like domain-containing protein [Proteobacteria bacterium]|nr:flippase-like domain-containing protein [Pseudomonadota bacterium]